MWNSESDYILSKRENKVTTTRFLNPKKKNKKIKRLLVLQVLKIIVK